MNQPLVLCGTTIRQDAEGRHSLNDLHKAAVAQGVNPRSTEPGKFFRSPRPQALIAILEREGPTPNWGNAEEAITPNWGNAPVAKNVGGTKEDTGTYVCIELVIAYGQFVSAEFDLKVIRTFLTVVNGQHALPHIQNLKFLDRLRPHWAEIARLALRGLKNKQIAVAVMRSAASVGRCLARMYEVGYCNPVEVFKARLKPETAARWAIQKPVAASWGKADEKQLSLVLGRNS